MACYGRGGECKTKKIKDRVLLGAIGGVAATLPIQAYSELANWLDPLGASLFLPKAQARTREGKLVGFLANTASASMAGIMITYVLSASGRDAAILKGAGVGAWSWVIVQGLVGAQVLGQKRKKARESLMDLGVHVLAGAIGAEVIARLGDDGLFPRKGATSVSVPLVATGRGR